MRAARLELALHSGALVLPQTGRIAVLRPQAGDDLSVLPKDRVTLVQGFRPDHDRFAAAGWDVTVTPPADPAAVLVCLPRAKAEAHALLAEAAAAPLSIVDGQKLDGIDSILRDLRRRGTVSEPVIKAHGKLFTFRADLSDWRAAPRQVDGYETRPGVFSADGPDPASVLLADALPALSGRVIDLGAGWGFLARRALERGARSVDLVEAEADALECARVNVPDPRARFHWADALTWRPEALARHVICNPPFHRGRETDPQLGMAFVAAAARMLAPDGTLWLVANRHLPYADTLARHFRTSTEIGGNGSFRVIRAEHPLKRQEAA
ncbi:class I SAM-dependent methyltransferase [Falsirhodobacter algicola]|uniref:Methyltransferase n=1 Tax=Falsirhodobacter algicola TaxID=2692330 RepID=A0A8J8SJV3_9RHOB|nr:methyltransferase [Falsirhodobacter algicola]QUS34841.1 methyltransferase [Falsirhodobacter algicola]